MARKVKHDTQGTSQYHRNTGLGIGEGLDTSKKLYEVSKRNREEFMGFLRILDDLLGIPGDSRGFSGIPEDS